FDLAAALLSSILLAPLIVCLAALIRLNLGSPIFFRQRRPGLHGDLFTLIKFRTMRDAADSNDDPLPATEPLPPFGRWLRSSSLDDVPELVNVLRGEMSLAGPRPLLPQYLDLYTPERARRHDVLPGITGWAQINGRNTLSWEEKFALDVWYVDHQSLWLDI